MDDKAVIEFTTVKNINASFWEKRYMWIVYKDDVLYHAGYNYTRRGAEKDAKLYMAKLDDGRYFR